MKHLSIIAIALFCLVSYSFAQDFPADTTFEELSLDSLNFDDLNIDSLAAVEEAEAKSGINYSYGWFPVPTSAESILVNLCGHTGGIYSSADNIFSSSFLPTKSGFSTKEPKDRERKRKAAFSDEEGPSYLENGLDIGYLSFVFPIKGLTMLSLNLGYKDAQEVLFTYDDTKEFIDFSGNPIHFREINGICQKEYGVTAGISIRQPIYGAFINTLGSYNYSYYYFELGYTYEYIYENHAYQFSQIANNKERIRYSNGKDLIETQNNAHFPTLNKNRDYIDLALGISTGSDNFEMNYALHYTIGLRSVLKDADWKQNYLSFEISISLNKVYEIIETLLK